MTAPRLTTTSRLAGLSSTISTRLPRSSAATGGGAAPTAGAKYDVVLMGVEMPDMDGLEAARRIHRDWTGAERPRIFAMTANAMPGDRETCQAAGMDDT